MAQRNRKLAGDLAQDRTHRLPQVNVLMGVRMVGIPADEAAEGGELASRFLRHRRRVVPSPCKAGTECLIIGELLKLSVKGAPPLPHSGHISSSPPGNSSPPLRPKNEVWIICWAVTGLVPVRQVVFRKLVQVPVSDYAYLRITDHERSATALRRRRVDRKRGEAGAASSMSRSGAHGQWVYSFSGAARDPSERSYQPQVPGAPLKGPTMFGVIQPP